MRRTWLLIGALLTLLLLEGCCCPVRRQARIMARYGVLDADPSCCGSSVVIVKPRMVDCAPCGVP